MPSLVHLEIDEEAAGGHRAEQDDDRHGGRALHVEEERRDRRAERGGDLHGQQYDEPDGREDRDEPAAAEPEARQRDHEEERRQHL